MKRALLDNSVLQRISRSPMVELAVRELIEAGHHLCSNPVSVLEAGSSARSASEHQALVVNLTQSFTLLPLMPEVGELAVEMQARLFGHGAGRGVGVVDLLQAACAVIYDVRLIHYDADFELLARWWPDLDQAWVVPRGSVD